LQFESLLVKTKTVDYKNEHMFTTSKSHLEGQDSDVVECSSIMGIRRNSSPGRDDAMQMDVQKTRYPFYTTKKMPVLR